MLKNILQAIIIYISTSIDYLFILLIIFSNVKRTPEVLQVYLGQYLSTGILVGISLIAAYVVNFIPQQWIIGLLGLIPLALGVRFAVVGEEEVEEEEISQRLLSSEGSNIIWTVALISLAAGGDNLGVYIPYFASTPPLYILVTIFVFFLGVGIFCRISQKLAEITAVNEVIERYEKIIVPVVFIGLGIYIMVENGTVSYLWRLIQS